MEMQLDPQLIKIERERRAWSQSHLANVAGLGLRTVQRIEATGNASYESAAAIAAVFALTVADLVPVAAVAAAAAAGAAAPAQPPAESISHDHVQIGRVAVWAERSTRTTIQFAAAANLIAAALILTSLRAPNTDVADVQPDAPQAESVPVVADAAPPFDCPGEPINGRAQLNLQIQCESVDSAWAQVTERQLRSQTLAYLSDWPDLSERFRFERVHCRTTICEIQFLDSAPSGPIYDANRVHPDTYLMRQLTDVQFEIYEEAWGTQFDPWKTMAIGSLVNGDHRIYLQRVESRLARL